LKVPFIRLLPHEGHLHQHGRAYHGFPDGRSAWSSASCKPAIVRLGEHRTPGGVTDPRKTAVRGLIL